MRSSSTPARLTQLRTGERVSFTRRRAVHGAERRGRRRGVRRADRARLPRRAGDDRRTAASIKGFDEPALRASRLARGVRIVTRSRQQRVRGLRQAAAPLTDRDLSEQIGLEHQRVRPCPSRPASRSSAGELVRFARGDDAPSRSRLRGRDEFQAPPVRRRACRARAAVRCAECPSRRTACGVMPRAEQHVGERRRLRRGVPAVDVERRIRLGDALGLHARQRRVERARPVPSRSGCSWSCC